ncbi:hypothetical protein ERO13_D04G149900v2 [Gossypium hirsutum]|uniref:DUF639 domain-containing protein n=3 Tax=Gossypium TaxID=3633 RepID=A0A5D2VF26_GOSMU|nr:uncharacterized protein LOC107898884 [Gossypium hirsutum]TYH77857.1 hypothetical protein ES332_D04G185000v1 [Gossypium tomentosum]TYI87998.1 hypothetical protein E1A91_D04G175300v1 [Gossypium mustelinum]KAG4152907.1 hypothetical protein ERO13_D04G149900v2 [Gossypium hirsutum]TYH77858.1 hypothetical protein ES332_D04G185000v1 [Gossypium tomentosum]TYI87999.1 hypothetical protein E1A91_D04G175300v1 [Gossypium mustelinum]
MEGVWENFMRNNQDTFKSLFQRKKSLSNDEDSQVISPRPIPQLSALANSVVFRCSKILKVPAEELQHRFDIELPESVKQLFTYARNFLEFCSYQALYKVSRSPDYLSDPDFRRLTYEMMLAWEAPCVECERGTKETSSNNEEVEDDEDGSLFYSSSISMAVQVDDKKTVGREAFERIAPVCAVVADIITVHNLFDALTSSSGPRLHFIIYDKYLRSLDKVIKAAKNTLGPSLTNLPLSDVEIIIDIEGAVPTQPVLQHVGISAWPGRLTLTNYALYFEALGVGVYDKAVRYDLVTDLKQVIKPELTGPLGARLFDKAVMYKSTTVTEPVYFEFPEFKGNFRRNFWLDISLEILYSHRFARKNNFKETQQSEVLARAILGIYRYRALREAFQFFSSQYKTLLSFNLAESLPGGDVILETLASRLALLNVDNSPHTVKNPPTSSPFSLLALSQLGFIPQKNAILDGEALIVGDFCVGETNPLETAVKQSISDTGRAEAAQATVNQVKVEGIETNLAVMKELLLPVIQLATLLELLSSWKAPIKSTVFLMLTSFAIIRGWIAYILALVFVFFAIVMLWNRYFNKGKPLEAFRIIAPPNRNAVEQLLTLQEVISQYEALIQTANVILLKIRAILFAVLPQATDRVALSLVFLAVVLAFVPLRFLILFVFVEAFTRELPYRRDSNDRWLRRLREWWFRIPAAPVQLVRADEKKKKL